ncbi:MAG: hypothetical protein JSW52_03190 [Candidatus Coatesbacteria bacterium]|nr:MAG: hypothetical protein JSW52_03190 [Candidatus Coatesbacteria bacterium]
MFKNNNLVKAAILVLVIAAVSILSCSSEVATTGSDYGASRAIAISGKCIAPSEEPLEDAYVEWWCEQHGGSPVFLGDDTSDEDGKYEIEHTWGTAHDGCTIKGIASYPGYKDVERYIIFYSSLIPYEDIDFVFEEE